MIYIFFVILSCKNRVITTYIKKEVLLILQVFLSSEKPIATLLMSFKILLRMF